MAEAMATVSCVRPAEESAGAGAEEAIEGLSSTFGSACDPRCNCGDCDARDPRSDCGDCDARDPRSDCGDCDALRAAWGDCAPQGEVWQGELHPNFTLRSGERPASVGSGGGNRVPSEGGDMPALVRRSLPLRLSGLHSANDASALVVPSRSWSRGRSGFAPRPAAKGQGSSDPMDVRAPSLRQRAPATTHTRPT